MDKPEPLAFPTAGPDVNYSGGMTLRDYFAGQALAGLLAHHGSTEDSQSLREVVGYDAYAYADAMLTERSK